MDPFNPAKPILAKGYEPSSVLWYTVIEGFLFIGAS